jgi:hypothetical protein
MRTYVHAQNDALKAAAATWQKLRHARDARRPRVYGFNLTSEC